MSYIAECADTITRMAKNSSVLHACEFVKKKYNLKQSVATIRRQYYRFQKSKDVSVSTRSTTQSNQYKTKAFVLSAWNKTGYMMDIDEYCKHYKLPRQDITSYKLVSHTGTPFYNIVFKENVTEELKEFDFDSIIKKHIKPVTVKKQKLVTDYDFDVATYTDLHTGMDPDKFDNSMYAEAWNKDEIIKVANTIVSEIIKNRKSSVLYVDDLGDLLDGLDGKTRRGGHDLPQNMTNEAAFDCALQFKMTVADGVIAYYDSVVFNNVCNDNHSGSFGYFVNKAFKEIIAVKYSSENVTVTNHRTFLSHYFVNDVCFIISHGKDDRTLKFGFPVHIDKSAIEKIDQYCKHNQLYKKAKRIVFKKGDSHQALFDMCGSDDFDYFNYPAASPASQWIQNNYKKGRKGFVIENYKGIESTLIPILK